MITNHKSNAFQRQGIIPSGRFSWNRAQCRIAAKTRKEDVLEVGKIFKSGKCGKTVEQLLKLSELMLGLGQISRGSPDGDQLELNSRIEPSRSLFPHETHRLTSSLDFVCLLVV